MKRLSDSRTPDSLRHHLDRVEDEDDPDSPLYACPTAYGYAKVGAYSRRDESMPATPPATLSQNQVRTVYEKTSENVADTDHMSPHLI
jgi:hypothetical protein